MASGRTVLTGNDPVSDQLISHVSSHVVGALRKQFATGPLGLRDEQYDNIEEEQSGAERRNQEVLRTWRNKSRSLTVQILLDKLPEWQQKGYISANVWGDIKDVVDPNLLPMREVPADRKKKESKTNTDFNFIKKLVKTQLRRRCRNALSTDWLPDEKAKTFPLRDYYSDLGWKKKVKRAMRDTSVQLQRIHDIFVSEFEDGGINLAVIGRAGTGKTSSMAMLALDWVNGNEDISIKTKLGRFDMVFLIELRYVNDNSSLEQIIIKQHGLKGKSVGESQIRSILEEQSVLLILDGYDEYQKGTNEDIDSAIEDTVGNCFLILTSRDGDYISKETLNKFDGEIEITGFSPSTIFQCAAKYLESEEMAKKLIEEASIFRIKDLLQSPIILFMVCVLYYRYKKLPKSQTAIARKIVQMCLNRSTLKHFGRKWREIPGLEAKLYQLGQLAWKTLKDATRQLLLPKSEIRAISEDLFKLGILHDTSTDEASTDEQPEMMTFAHKLFHEYWAAYYASRRLSKVNSKEEIDHIFKIEHDMERHWNVLKFTCGLMEDSSLLIERICEAFVAIATRPKLGESFGSLYGILYLKDLYREKTVGSLNPFNNGQLYYTSLCHFPDFSTLNSHYNLYYFNGWDKTYPEERNTKTVEQQHWSISTGGSLKPCSVVVHQGLQILMDIYFSKICEIKQRIKCLIVFGSPSTVSTGCIKSRHRSVRTTGISDATYEPANPFRHISAPACRVQRTEEPAYEIAFEIAALRNKDSEIRLEHLAVAVFHRMDCMFPLALACSLEKCTELKHLTYSYCTNISFKNLKNNTVLKALTVKNCSLGENAEAELYAQLRYLSQLEQISFKGMKHEKHLAKNTRAGGFLSLTSLKRLSLWNCMLTTPTVVALMKSLVQCPLVELDLSDNFLGGFISELYQTPEVAFRHLERMNCNNSNLLKNDTLAFAGLIYKNRVPVIKTVSMKGNEFACDKVASEELEKSCEHFRKIRGHRVQIYMDERKEIRKRERKELHAEV